jgi:hypothetical protein
MGQGLGTIGFIQKIDPNGSEFNSTSFYSNNTSNVSNNLSNSRYMLNRRDNLINPTGDKVQNS